MLKEDIQMVDIKWEEIKKWPLSRDKSKSLLPQGHDGDDDDVDDTV